MKKLLLLLLSFALSACGGSDLAGQKDPDESVLAGLLAVPITEVQAVRFLWKSSFGPTPESIARLRQLGYAQFLDEQLAMSPNLFNAYMLGAVPDENAGGVDSYCRQFAPTESADVCGMWVMGHNRAPSIVFMQSALRDPDQLRLRVAWALSQILVVSTNFSQNQNYGARNYMQLLRNGALGNYRDLLLQVSKDPYMGNWLDLAGSHKSNPNQNYARELLQLFSVGVFKRLQDGQFALDANGKRIENYSQQDVLNFSRTLTGWGYPNPLGSDRFIYSGPLVSVAEWHDQGSKTLLNGQTVSAGQTPEQNLQLVVSNVFSHSSTAPHIVRQLIQLLVTSNPSPAYVARVVKVWNNNGYGTKGDLKSVVRSIFLDPECLNPPDVGGRLLEPVVAMTGLARAVGIRSDGVELAEASAAMSQRPFSAPSVFNFYPPDFALPFSQFQRQAPQFGIVTIDSTVQRLNAARRLIFNDTIAPMGLLPAGISTGSALEWPSQWRSMAAHQLPQLVNLLNIRLAGGALEAAARDHIVAHVSSLPSGSEAANLHRLRMVTWLIFSSPQFMTHR